MDILQHYSLTRFMGFVPAIKKNVGEWWIVEVSLSGKTSHNVTYIAVKLKEYFEGKEGVIFICNANTILVLAHMDKEATEKSMLSDIQEKLPKHSCAAQAKSLTPDGLITIKFRLEEFAEEKNAKSPDTSMLVAKRARQERIVMIVDDDRFIRSLINKTFRHRAKIIECKDMDGAVEAYRENLPDVVFLDIHLPGGSGLDILAKIFDYDDSAYVFLLSADSVKDNIMTAKDLGAVALSENHSPWKNWKPAIIIARQCPETERRKSLCSVTASIIFKQRSKTLRSK